MARSRPADEAFPTAQAFLPPKLTLPALRSAAATCQGCPLFKLGTQTVFGRGPAGAKLMFVGEQPGDQEDRAGEPFVGPAGRVLDEALDEVGIPRDQVYLTNAVKHFKWTPRGARRLHAKPTAREVAACRPWLVAELQAISPAMVVCLGATAAQALLGKDFRITRDRGRAFEDTPHAPWLMATAHPSAILRVPDESSRTQARQQFIADLRLAAEHYAHLIA